MDQAVSRSPTPRKPVSHPGQILLRVTSFLLRRYHFVNAQYAFIVTDTICKDKNWWNNLNK